MQIETIVQSGHYLNILDAAFSPDGYLIATCSPDETVRLWDVAMGCEIAVLKGHKGPVYKICFSHNGRWLASCSWDLTVRIWDIQSRCCIRVLDSSEQKSLMSVDEITFSKSDQYIVSGGMTRYSDPTQIRVWHWESGQEIKNFEIPETKVSALAFSPDESLIAIAQSGFEYNNVRVIDFETGNTLLFLQDEVPPRKSDNSIRTTTAVDLIFHEDSRTLVFASLGKINLIDSVRKECVAKLPIDDFVFKVWRQLDGKLVAFGKRSITIWDIALRQHIETIDVCAHSISPNGDLLARSSERDLELIDRHTCQVIRKLGGQLNLPEEIGNLHQQFVLAANPMYPILASAAPNGMVRIWDLRKAKAPITIAAHPSFIEAIAFDPRGKILATSGDDNTIKLWQVQNGVLLHVISLDSTVQSLVFSTDGSRLIAGLYDGSVHIIQPNSGEDYETVSLPEGEVSAVMALPFSREILATSFRKLYIWNNDLSEHRSFENQFPITSLACNHEGTLAIAGGSSKWFGAAHPKLIQGFIILLDFNIGSFTHLLQGHTAQVRAITFDPAGKTIASGGADGKVIVWDVDSGDQIFSIDAHAGDVTGICFTSDGAFIASIGLDSVIRLWEASTGELAATLISLNEEDYVISTDKGYYNSTKPGLRSVMFRADNQIFPFEQFDLQLNRPDQVLKRLGFALPGIVEAYAKAHQRRIQKLGLNSDISEIENIKTPQIKLATEPPASVFQDRKIQLNVLIQRAQNPLDRLMVYCNDIPICRKDGIDLKVLGQNNEISVDIDLASGDNKVQLYAADINGIQSPLETFRTFFVNPQQQSKLFILAVGISKYCDSGFNLEYAAKDAGDLVQEIQRLQSRFSQVETCVLLNEQATQSNILKSKAFLEEAEIDDHIIIFFAGHGTIQGLDYFFLPSDFNPEDVETTSVSYDQIELLLNSTSARRRLVLLDTCHSGEPEEFSNSHNVKEPNAGVQKVRSFRDFPAVTYSSKEPRNSRIPLLNRLPELFADLRRDSGAYVIAAAGASEYAREFEELKNGVFTSCVIQALREGNADRNKDGIITISELYRFVTKNVETLTGGNQRPITRSENMADDFPVI